MPVAVSVSRPTAAVILALSLLFSPSYAAADDLLAVYREARQQDPTLAAGQFLRDANLEKAPQGRALLLPSLSISGTMVWNNNRYEMPTVTRHARYNNNGYQVTLTQPLFRWQNWVQYQQGQRLAAQAEVEFSRVEQDLILRVTQAYFDVLYADENLRAVRANLEAIAQQLELAKKSFEVGAATITDSHEAQARYDIAQAQEIAALNEYHVKRRALEAIINRPVDGVGSGKFDLAPLRNNATLNPPQPANMDSWVNAAEESNLTVQIQAANADIAEKEIAKQRAAHYPTVDLVANSARSNGMNTNSLTAVESTVHNVGVQVNIPVFQGGMTTSLVREAQARHQAALSSLEVAKRSAALAARQYYLGVTNGLAQVKALSTALASSQSALESNRLGYEVGVRINIDVLNAENQVYTTRRDLARARLDTLLALLSLKSAVGTLQLDDIVAINAMLVGANNAPASTTTNTTNTTDKPTASKSPTP